MSAQVFHFPNRIDPARLRPEWVACIIVSLAGVVGMDGVRQVQPRAAMAQRIDLHPVVRTAGDVIAPPEQVAYITPNFPAPVHRVRVLLGANVKEGQALADLEAPGVDERLAAATVAHKSAEQVYKSAQAKPDPAVSAARTAYASARAEERHARARFAAWEYESRTLESESESTDYTLVSGDTAAPAPNVDLDRLAYERQVAGQMLWSALQARDHALAGLRENAERAKSELVAAQRERRRWQVLAPMSGTVIRMDLKPGVQPSTSDSPAVTIVNLNELVVATDLPAGAEQAVRPGSKAKIEIGQLPNRTYEGKVKSVQDVLAPRGNVVKRAVVQVTNKQGFVKPGMQASVAFTLPVRKKALVVPIEAVQFADGGRTTVRVVTPRGREERAVTLGASDGAYQEVCSGLRPDEAVELPAVRH